MLAFKDWMPYGPLREMPHDHVPLAQAANGEIGPLCHGCGIRLTFGQSMIIDEHYFCWQCYQQNTGAGPSTSGKKTEKRFYR